MKPDASEPARGTAYPSTQLSWIEEHLSRGPAGLGEVNRHIMQVYSEPLQRHVARTGYRALGAPEELVSSFFADRLERPQYLREWQRSGKRLRHWLRNGLGFFLKELARETRRDAHRELAVDPLDEGAPEDAVDRDFALSVIRVALRNTRAELERADGALHYAIFYEHHADGVPYSELAAKHGLGLVRAQVMGRTGRNVFRRSLRSLVGRDCGRLQDVEGEIEALMECLS